VSVALPENVLKFLEQNKVATVCLLDHQSKPYCINCFYAFDAAEATFVFKSSYGTTHENLIKASAAIAGTVLPDKIEFTALKGLQFTGVVTADYIHGGSSFNGLYAKMFPMSLVLPGYFWKVKIEYLKFTDNSLGFGNKTIWKRDDT
jgi:uncharacterized protein YhbP (UPF0306 family)